MSALVTVLGAIACIACVYNLILAWVVSRELRRLRQRTAEATLLRDEAEALITFAVKALDARVL